MSTENTDKELKRVVGVFGLAANVVNISIGGGIYVLPALIGLQLGAASVIGYAICAVMFAAIILCYVEIGSRVKTAGGSYAYVETAFGSLAGFIINWLFFLGWGIIGSAAVMNIVADSLSVVFPVLLNPLMRGLLFFFLLGSMVLINIGDAKKSVRFMEYYTILKLLPLFGIIIFGFSYIESDNIRIEHTPPLNAFNNTALILFFAFAGFETSLNVSGEIKNPKRTVPRGILLGGIFVLLIYMLIQTVTQGVLGTQLNQFKDAPLAGVAERFAGATGVTVLLFAAALSGLGSVNGDVLASPRLLYAGAKDGLFPKFLAKIHPRFSTPYLAVITYAAAIFIFSVSGGFKQLAILASGALLLIYLAVVLAMLKLRKRKFDSTEKLFRVPGGLLIPVIAITAIVYVLSNLSGGEIVSILLFVVLVSMIYFVMKMWQRKSAYNSIKSKQEEKGTIKATAIEPSDEI